MDDCIRESEVLDLIREARKAHEDAGNDPFHVGAVTVCEELERVLRPAKKLNDKK